MCVCLLLCVDVELLCSVRLPPVHLESIMVIMLCVDCVCVGVCLFVYRVGLSVHGVGMCMFYNVQECVVYSVGVCVCLVRRRVLCTMVVCVGGGVGVCLE